MAVIKPDILLKQYHAKSPVSLRALWTIRVRLNACVEQAAQLTSCDEGANIDLFNYWMKRKPETVVKSRTINGNAFYGRLIHCGICLGDHEGDEELVDAPFENELLDELLEEELDEAAPEVELELIEATSAFETWSSHSPNRKISHIISYSDLPGIRHLHLWAEDTGGRGTLAAGPRGSARFKKGHRIENLFGFPTFILSGHVGHHPAINKGREDRSIQRPLLGRLADHGLPLHLPAAEAALSSVRDQHISSKPRRLTNSNPPGAISDPRPKNHALRPT
ncbi:hypothetical protein Cgig2_002951 [Carnegiea gigantea]|uniref:Uncharacterized protein n=1 Tax=Carnegiea gigantea TaxID=171969 RepID=A0A9Q1Q7X0_9CARY|nr:hypothetical protein Cgig2_002951 [Carnegiea gigantea]